MSRAVPHLFTRLKVAAKIVPWGVIIGAVVITQGGVSHLILSTSSMGETALVFAALPVLCLIGLAPRSGCPRRCCERPRCQVVRMIPLRPTGLVTESKP
jgi:hypothetical protein